MNREDITMIGFEIVAYAGDARSKLLDALTKAQKGDFKAAEQLIKEGEENIVKAHNAQTDILSKEAGGENLEMSFIMIHGQDHLMTTILLKDITKHLIELYKKGV
ncbi:MAG: PTS lactose/cellobiose transporter subunit IIA [Leptotrichiaceae bacterium]|nr:PTS lactose/cellobiose transporter subunit IIA [Leptotrichiaceae bacterium]